MPKPAVPATVESLLEKGDGVLVKRNGVWTYPNAPNDRSGTNLVMPIEFVSEAAVQEALTKGNLVPSATSVDGVPTSVVRKPEGDVPVRVFNMAHAGSVEAATELPLNSRPTHDAGKSDAPDVYEKPKGPEMPKTIAPAPGSPVVPATPAVSAPAKP